MAVVSPLPEPDNGGFLNLIRNVSDTLLNVPKKVQGFFGQNDTVSPLSQDQLPSSIPDQTSSPSVKIPKVMYAPQMIQKIMGIHPNQISGGQQTPTPTPTQQPIPQSQYAQVLQQFFPSTELSNATRVMMGESSMNPNAINVNSNGSRDWGLFQINDIHAQAIKNQFGWTMKDLLDPAKNIRVASWLYNQQGWKPWVAAKRLGIVR